MYTCSVYYYIMKQAAKRWNEHRRSDALHIASGHPDWAAQNIIYNEIQFAYQQARSNYIAVGGRRITPDDVAEFAERI